MLERGEVIDGIYEILGPIGRGGTAVVYSARRREDGEDVAIKVLAYDAMERDVLHQRFLGELLVVSRVRHPNIVEILDFGVMGCGSPYIVMELLRGDTLLAVIRRHGALPEERVIKLFAGALEALAVAHARGVVHQDLKPSNLFLRKRLDGSEDLVLVDFGIASRIHDPSARVPEWAGTPRYTPPEYILRREVRPSLDVYQVGLVLAEALAARPVVTSKIAKECMARHLDGRLDLGTEVVTSRLYPVIRRALSVDPVDRYADAGELLAALREAAVRQVFTAAMSVEDDPTQSSLSAEAPHEVRLVPALAPPPVRKPSPALLVAGLGLLFGFVVGLAVALVLTGA